MRDGSAPIGENHIAVRKLTASPAPRLTTRDGTRTANGLLPWFTSSNMSGSFQSKTTLFFVAFRQVFYHGFSPEERSAGGRRPRLNGDQGQGRFSFYFLFSTCYECALMEVGLKRQLGLFDALMIICGDMIGSGIFFATGAIAETLPTPGGVLLVWVLGGVLALTGALCCAELSASLPYAGGDYIYIREAYGKLMGFLSGWSSFLVNFSGAIAFLAVILNGFVSFFFPALGSQEVIFSIPLPLIPINATAGTVFSILVVLLLSG